MAITEDMTPEEIRQDILRWKMRKKYGPGIDTLKKFAKGKSGWREIQAEKERAKSQGVSKSSSCCVVPILIILLLLLTVMF